MSVCMESVNRLVPAKLSCHHIIIINIILLPKYRSTSCFAHLHNSWVPLNPDVFCWNGTTIFRVQTNFGTTTLCGLQSEADTLNAVHIKEYKSALFHVNAIHHLSAKETMFFRSSFFLLSFSFFFTYLLQTFSHFLMVLTDLYCTQPHCTCKPQRLDTSLTDDIRAQKLLYNKTGYFDHTRSHVKTETVN